LKFYESILAEMVSHFYIPAKFPIITVGYKE